MQYPCFKAADSKGIAILEQLVELTAVAGKFSTGVEYLPENVLHLFDVRANADAAPEFFVEVWCGGQVIDVNVGFQNPLYC